jgi:uncharacterized protein YciI
MPGAYRVHHILFYDYVDDILERRGPYREAHLARIRDESRIVMAGALGDPAHGAAIVFGPDATVAEIGAFAEADPYVTAGLVRASRIEPWNVV